MRKDLLLDSGLLLSSLLDLHKASAPLDRLCALYDRVWYEASGKSALERSLRNLGFLAGKLAPIYPESICDPSTGESELLEATVREGLRRGPIIHALHNYQILKGGGWTSPEETLRYVIHLLLLARQLRADLAFWPPRQQLFTSLFSEAGLDISTATSDAGLREITTSPCTFPYLPSRTITSSETCFTLVTVESAASSDDRSFETAIMDPGSSDRGRQIFISYSHKDTRWLQLLLVHLKPLVRSGSLAAWSDQDIEAGDAWLEQIREALRSSGAAVLIVTPNFLASDFIMNEELPFLVARARRGEMKLFWIAATASLYRETELSRIQALNDPAKPLDTLAPPARQKELVAMCEQILKGT